MEEGGSGFGWHSVLFFSLLGRKITFRIFLYGYTKTKVFFFPQKLNQPLIFPYLSHVSLEKMKMFEWSTLFFGIDHTRKLWKNLVLSRPL